MAAKTQPDQKNIKDRNLIQTKYLNFQRLYSVPSILRIDLPFGTDADFTLDDLYNHPIGQIGISAQSSVSRNLTTTFASSPASSDGIMSRSGGFTAFPVAGCPYVSF